MGAHTQAGAPIQMAFPIMLCVRMHQQQVES